MASFALKYFSFIILSALFGLSIAKNDWDPDLALPLTPDLRRFPSPARIKQELSNFNEEQFWKDAVLSYNNLKSMRRNSSEVLAMIEKDLKRAETGDLEPEKYDFLQCYKDVRRMVIDSTTELYAIKMFDSWGTPEGGFLEGNVRWPGHYYECKISGNEDFSGKWCLSYYGLLFSPSSPGLPIDMTLGICFPSTCSNEAIKFMYQKYFIQLEFPPLKRVQCPVEAEWMDIDTICAVIIGIMLSLLLAGSVYDVIMRYSRNYSKANATSTIPKKLLMSFSVISNTEQIIDMKKKPGNIPALDGIRVITTTWVIMGHVLQMMFYGLDNTVFSKRQVLKDPGYMVVINAFYSVDTFFFLSGLLVTYLGLKHLDKSKGFLNVPMMYLQRYLRLTPVYAFAILFHMSLYKFLGDGPGWVSYAKSNYDLCKDNWWTNLLYISNMYPQNNYCYAVAWYLSDDMQMFLIAPIFILLFYHFNIIGITSSLTVTAFATIYNGLVTYYHDLQPTLFSVLFPLSYFYRWFIVGWLLSGELEQSYTDNLLTNLYYMPWARIHAYMIGMITGYILYASKGKIKIHKAVVIIGSIIAAGSALAVVYGPYPYVKDMEFMPTDLSAFYSAMSRPVFVTALAWVVIVCCSGYGGPVTTFLDWKVFKPLSRLTYSTYIVHIYVLYYYGHTQDKPIHFLTINYVYIFVATIVLAFGFGYLLAVFIEWPFIGVFKTLLNPSPPRKINKVDPLSSKTKDSSSEWSSYSDHVNHDEQSSLGKDEKKMGCTNQSYVNCDVKKSDDTKF